MLHQVLADGGIRRAVSHAAGSDEGQQSALAKAVKPLDEKVIVDGARGLPSHHVIGPSVRPIIDDIMSERDIARHEVEPPGLACLDLFEAFDADGLPRIVSREKSQDAPCQEVVFERYDLRLFARQRTRKDAHSRRWVEHAADGLRVRSESCGDGADDARVGVKRSEDAAFEAAPKARGVASRSALIDDFTKFAD